MNTRRRRPRRASIAIAAAAAAGLLLAACSSASSASGGSTSAAAAGGASSSLPKTLVFSPLALAIPAMKQLSTGVDAYAGSKGWKVQVQDPNYSANTQATELNDVVNTGVAGALWIIAVQPSSMTQTLKTAQSKGIPALTNGVPSDYGFSGLQPGITFDVIDYKEFGTNLGKQMGACINKKLGGNAQVLYASSTAGTAGKAEIDSSAVTALKATAPKAQIVTTLIESDRAKAQTDIGNALQGHPGINAVMSTTDEAALGALGAFDAAGKPLPCVTEQGGDTEVLADVKSGKIYASIHLDFQGDMTQSFNTLAAMQSNPKQIGKQLYVPQQVITAAG
ncbi:MAG TPA: substrate-binding domain-containing protein [Streptosporangiaceae bacterium]|nr:substrate-binding domain-containing protein [Streptosporangiaceae bacterium]